MTDGYRLDADAIVVGAGFAGLRAARDIAGAGKRVLMLEARDRLGGRTWTRTFPGTDELVELGGAWFTGEQHDARAELERYGLDVGTRVEASAVRWRTGGELRTGLPVPVAELLELERALASLARDADRHRSQALGDVGSLSFAAYVDRLHVATATREFLEGWWSIVGGVNPRDGAVVDALATIASHGGVTSLIASLRHFPAQGWGALAATMAGAPGVEVRLSTPVQAVRLTGDVVEAVVEGGAFRSSCAVVALPVNALAAVGFEPALPEATLAAAGCNAGRALKVWARATGVPASVLAVGAGRGLHWLLCDRRVEGDALVVGFGWEDPGFDPGSRADVEEAVRAFFPEATLVAWDWHDWNADPFSRGTWATAAPGKAELLDPARFPPHGRVIFAGSDIAPREAGWIDGALASGAEAAATALRLF